ncbi:MAG: hypothetical protein GY853_05675 [PVC group bacterium]|nr:hypothetical protein [PVC group bacterium]
MSGSHACELYAQDIHSGRNRLYLNESGWTDDGVKLVQRALNRFLWKCGKTSFEEISDDERFVPAAFNSGVRSSCPTPERVEKAQGRGKTSFATKPAKTIPLLRCTLPALEAMLLQAIDSKQNALTDRIFAIMQRKGGKKTG